MNKDSIVVYNLYAQYFNTETDACEKEQGWAFPKLLWLSPLLLTIDRRKKFNTLVVNINKAIDEVVDDINEHGDVKYKIASADWDIWPREGVSGQYCVPQSTGRYPDPKQPDLQFFKPDTFLSKEYHDELKKRTTPEQERELRKAVETSDDVHDSLLWKTSNPPAEALHRLDRRAPAPPGCPGDTGIISKLNLGTPDAWGKFFHPNELGHETIAAFAIQTMIDTRAKVLGIDNPSCAIADEFKCWQTDGRKGYANGDRMNENYKDFCDKVKPPADTVGWKSDVPPYHEGTPDEHSFSLQLTSDASRFDKDECLESFDRIINGCDGNDPENPMNWKFGGRYVRGEYTYEVNIKRDNRPWPPTKKPHGDCKGWYKGWWSDYKLHGGGWATWDKGEDTLRPSIKGCLGLGITAWKFEYYDKPDDKDNEWGLSVNLPIWVRHRCFRNDKVPKASGGSTNGCGGND